MRPITSASRSRGAAERKVGDLITFPQIVYTECGAAEPKSGFACCLLRGHRAPHHQAWAGDGNKPIVPGGPGRVVAVWPV